MFLRINTQYALRQQSTESGSTENTMFMNSQNVVLSCVYRTNISLKWLQEILQQHYGECAMKIARVGHRAGTQCSLVPFFQYLYCTVL